MPDGFSSAIPSVSVVVPVHNTASYLDDCMESLAGQTLRDIEIVCIDDGSTDSSPDMLASWARKDRRISVLRQECRGGGAARNAGMDAAKGKFLFFCDSDDACEPEMLEDLVSRAETSGADIAIATRAIWNAGLSAIVSRTEFPQSVWQKERPFPGRDLGADAFVLFGNPAWNKLFRRSFVAEKGLRFQEIPNSDDILFVDLAIAESNGICLSDRALYKYRSGRTGSAVSAMDRSPLSLSWAYSALRDALAERHLLAGFLPALSKAVFVSGGYQLQNMASATSMRTAYKALRELQLSLAERFPLLESGVLDERQLDCCRALLESDDPVPFLLANWRQSVARANALFMRAGEFRAKWEAESRKRKKEIAAFRAGRAKAQDAQGLKMMSSPGQESRDKGGPRRRKHDWLARIGGGFRAASRIVAGHPGKTGR